MEKIFSFNFPPLLEEDRSRLRRMMRLQRLQILKDLLGKAKSGDLAGELGERATEVCRCLSEIVHLSKQNGERFWEILDFWPMPFCLSRLAYPDGLHDENHKEHIISNLSTMLLLERLLNSNLADDPATYVTRTDELGRIAGLSKGVWLQLKDQAFRATMVEWRCSPREASAWLAGKSEPEFTTAIPLQSNRFVEVAPLATSVLDRFPILQEPVIFGRTVNRLVGAYENTGRVEADPLPLKDSLTQARTTLAEVWPEAMEWADALIPAFVDLGVPPNRMRLSTSYEPGAPIFMGRVDDPFFHAEDLVHEIQHHRLFLFADVRNFKSWRDERQNYISPYRPDPRPLRGLIVGLHAFLAVNELRRRMIEHQQGLHAMRMKMAELHYENLFTFRTILEHEEFGEVGEALCVQMANTLAEHHSLVATWTGPEMERLFEAKINKHIALVRVEAAEVHAALKNDSPLYRNWAETARMAASFSSTASVQAGSANP